MHRVPPSQTRFVVRCCCPLSLSLTGALKCKELVAHVPGSRAETHSKAIEHASIVFLATPGGQPTLDVFTELYKAGLFVPVESTVVISKIVVDLTNPFALDHLKSTSGGEMLQAIGGPYVRIVKAFNTTGHEKYCAPTVKGEKIDLFVAGDNQSARETILKLAGDMGFNPVDAGGIASSRWMEALCYGWVHMAHKMGVGRDSGWKLLINK